jgi:hypothetical protein
MSQEPSSPASPVETSAAGITRARRTPSPLSLSRASLASREWMTNTVLCSRQISPTDRCRDSSPSIVSIRSLSRSAACAHNSSRSASTSASRACSSSRHRAMCSSILRSTLSIGFILPSSMLHTPLLRLARYRQPFPITRGYHVVRGLPTSDAPTPPPHTAFSSPLSTLSP